MQQSSDSISPVENIIPESAPFLRTKTDTVISSEEKIIKNKELPTHSMPQPIEELASDSSLMGPLPFSHRDSLSISSVQYCPDITRAREIVYTPIEEPGNETIVEATPPASWETGIAGTPRQINIGDNSGVLAIIAGMFVLMMLSYKHCKRLFSTMWQELWGMRHRANVFDEHTSNENRVLALMALQWSMCTGLLLYSGLSISGRALLLPANVFSDTAKLIALMACYYGAQLCLYNVVGFTFTTNDGRRLWVKGFTASQSLLGFALLIPSLVAIFYPTAAEIALIVGIFLYIVARIVFIVKGFRIFYTHFGSLLYFILYLCSLEIIPLIFIYEIALLLVNSL